MPRLKEMGTVVGTPGAIAAMERAGQSPGFFLSRHIAGDWGEVCEEDKAANDQSLIDGSRVLSAYRTLLSDRIWIITEAEGEDGKRESTTILLPEEY